MAPIKVLGSATSSCTQRVILVLRELGIEHDFQQMTLQKGEQKAPNYIRDVHPFGRVPALEDGDFRMFESRAICRYLVAKFGGTSTLNAWKKDDPNSIGSFEQEISIEYSYFDPSVKTLCFETLWKSMIGQGDANPEEVAKATGILTTCLDHYERLLSTTDYLAGKDFSLLDIYVMPWIPWFEQLGRFEQITQRPKLAAWWERVTTRPSWKHVLELLPKD